MPGTEPDQRTRWATISCGSAPDVLEVQGDDPPTCRRPRPRRAGRRGPTAGARGSPKLGLPNAGARSVSEGGGRRGGGGSALARRSGSGLFDVDRDGTRPDPRREASWFREARNTCRPGLSSSGSFHPRRLTAAARPDVHRPRTGHGQPRPSSVHRQLVGLRSPGSRRAASPCTVPPAFALCSTGSTRTRCGSQSWRWLPLGQSASAAFADASPHSTRRRKSSALNSIRPAVLGQHPLGRRCRAPSWRSPRTGSGNCGSGPSSRRCR